MTARELLIEQAAQWLADHRLPAVQAGFRVNLSDAFHAAKDSTPGTKAYAASVLRKDDTAVTRLFNAIAARSLVLQAKPPITAAYVRACLFELDQDQPGLYSADEIISALGLDED